MAGLPNLEQDQRLKELDKYARFFVLKSITAISTSRITNKPIATPSRGPQDRSEWFSVTLPSDVTKNPTTPPISFRNVAPSADGSLAPTCHCSVDVFVETTAGEKMIVESWNIVLDRIDTYAYRSNGSSPRQEPFRIYARLSLLLKSVVSTARLLPANRLARTQSSTSFTLCCRVSTGSGTSPMDHASLRNHHSVGSVDIEPIGRVSVRVAYCREAVLTDCAMGSSIITSLHEDIPKKSMSKAESYTILPGDYNSPKQFPRDLSTASFSNMSEAIPDVHISEVLTPTGTSPTGIRNQFPDVTYPAFSAYQPGLPLPIYDQSSDDESPDNVFKSETKVSVTHSANMPDEILADFAMVESTAFPFAELEEPLATFVSLLGANEEKISAETTYEQRKSFLHFSDQTLNIGSVLPSHVLPKLGDHTDVKSHLSEMENVQSAFDALVASLCDGDATMSKNSSAGGSSQGNKISFHLGVDSL